MTEAPPDGNLSGMKAGSSPDMSAPMRSDALRPATVRPHVELLLLLAGAGLLAVAGVAIMAEVHQLVGAFVLTMTAVILVLELPSRVRVERFDSDEDVYAIPARGSAAGRGAQA
jgi:hypothetical protein